MITDIDGSHILLPNEYQKLAARTDPDRTHRVVDCVTDIAPNGSWLLHSLIGLSGEVGELATAVQRWLYYGKDLDKTNVIEELGDLCWYLAQACRSMDVQLEDIMQANLRKLKFRYPERYTDFHAAEENRDREGEAKCIYQAVEDRRQSKPDPLPVPKICAMCNGSGLMWHGIEKDPGPGSKMTQSTCGGSGIGGFDARCMTAKEAIAAQTQCIGKETAGVCPNCKTKFSDRIPKFCPECGEHLHD